MKIDFECRSAVPLGGGGGGGGGAGKSARLKNIKSKSRFYFVFFIRGRAPLRRRRGAARGAAFRRQIRSQKQDVNTMPQARGEQSALV